MALAPPNVRIESLADDVFGAWTSILADEVTQPYFIQLEQFVADERSHGEVYPARDHMFTALHITAPHDTRVVMLGQDPYHGAGQAHGLAFSVPTNTPVPPSLRNVFIELRDDVGCAVPLSGNLEPWAQQGVLLLNTALTVRAGSAGSHAGKGWETFTDRIIATLGSRVEHCVFLLWGRHAAKKASLIADHHTIITSAHPSPLSAHNGFFGSRPFTRANAALIAHNQTPINWSVIASR